MTNIVTNLVWVINTNAIPVLLLTPDAQTTIFFQGFYDGSWLALGVLAVFAVKRVMRAPWFPSSHD